jgi:Fe-S cluster biogenesis protein NfuA
MQDAEKELVKLKIEEIRPALQADGGDIELVSIDDDGTVNVRLQGACAGCPGAMMTLQFGVQRVLQEAVPAVTRVVPVR